MGVMQAMNTYCKSYHNQVMIVVDVQDDTLLLYTGKEYIHLYEEDIEKSEK